MQSHSKLSAPLALTAFLSPSSAMFMSLRQANMTGEILQEDFLYKEVQTTEECWEKETLSLPEKSS